MSICVWWGRSLSSLQSQVPPSHLTDACVCHYGSGGLEGGDGRDSPTVVGKEGPVLCPVTACKRKQSAQSAQAAQAGR